MPRLKLALAYLGTRYQGWQVQEWQNSPQPPTVQGELEKALQTISGEKIRVRGAGRTDSGVHAEGQVAHCDIAARQSGLDWRRALNALLPYDIRVTEASMVSDQFDACAQVTRKAYTYRLWLDNRFTPPRLQPFVWNCGPLDLGKLDAAMPHLLGRQDFRSLQNAGTHTRTSIRCLFSISRSLACIAEAGAGAAEESAVEGAVDAGDTDRRHLVLRFEADGFLKQMVRNMVGLLVACGRGLFDPAGVPALLLARDRQRAPSTAPPQGLTLVRVWY